MNYVFNGDFVDRGAHSLEVIGLLMALKVSMPNRVWLVRGNHEDRAMKLGETEPKQYVKFCHPETLGKFYPIC